MIHGTTTADNFFFFVSIKVCAKEGWHKFFFISMFTIFLFLPPMHHAYSQEGHRRGWTALFLVERRLMVLEQSIQSERTREVYSPLKMRER